MGSAVMLAGLSAEAIATPQPDAPQVVAQSAPSPTSQESIQEIDSSVTRQYRPAVIYIPDPNTQELVPQSMLVGADEPAEIAVDQILQSYEGQDVGIQSYEVSVDSRTREAEINFEVNNPRGGRAFQSLSSANQYSLFEAIRETLLTEPVYNVEEVIFMANDISFDI
ncbi:hypothetical protein ACQ4M4_08375 [Leptolyngbya sp. AN02str]|uniref:hypothetical protein n=1 Tax=Leptolyngbya sp. AN02str TaxID=3423363 RepID=UPI003D315B6D